jgi:flagellar hook-associated protein 3 FlgL
MQDKEADMIRTTANMIRERWMGNIQTRLSSLDKYNNQIGSGKKVEKPADDPTGANRIVRIDEVLSRNDQYMANISEALHINSTAESVMDQVFSRMTRVKSLAIEGSNEASRLGGFEAFAEEIRGIKESVIDLVQTQVEGKYIFNGTAGEVKPYSDTGGAYRGDANMLNINLGNGQMLPLNMTGDRAFRETDVRSLGALFTSANPTITIPAATPLTFMVSDGMGVDTTITLSGAYDETTLTDAINTELTATGANIFSTTVDGELSFRFVNDTEGGEMEFTQISGDLEGDLGITEGVKNIFGVLDDLTVALDSNDLDRVSRMLGRIDRVNNNTVNQRGQYGSRARNLQFTQERLEEYNLTSQTLKEQVEGIDLPEVVMKLTAQEQAYQAALASGARIFQISILNYLR